jgi:hypothetical protein
MSKLVIALAATELGCRIHEGHSGVVTEVAEESEERRNMIMYVLTQLSDATYCKTRKLVV